MKAACITPQLTNDLGNTFFIFGIQKITYDARQKVLRKYSEKKNSKIFLQKS
jgi:hypothetical protein